MSVTGCPWYNEASQVEYDPEGAAALLDEAGWVMGEDCIREKDGVKAELNLLYSTGILCARRDAGFCLTDGGTGNLMFP